MSDYIFLRRVQLGASHIPTDKMQHFYGDKPVPLPVSLLIARYPDMVGFYLLYLDEQGDELTDTYHDSLEQAIAQAEWEFQVQPYEWEVLD
jgi:hypothetical protein